MTNQRVAFYRVSVRELLPPEDRVVAHLLRLMAAVDDLLSLHKLFMYSCTRVGNIPSEKEKISE
ncbi:MAG: hypothetical protein V3T60_16815 [Candidatus Binatia bacterium]